MRNHGGIGPTLFLHSILRHSQGYPVAHPWFGDDVLGSAASPSLRRSRFTTCRTSRPSPTRSSPQTRWSSTLWFSTQGEGIARRMSTGEPG